MSDETLILELGMKPGDLYSLLNAFVPVAKVATDRPHLHGIIVGQDGGIAASDGNRLHFVETFEEGSSPDARSIVVPCSVLQRFLANLRFFKAHEHQIMVFRATASTVSLEYSGDLYVPPGVVCVGHVASESAIPWRKVVPDISPKAERLTRAPSLSARYVSEASTFVGAFRSAVRVLTRGELDPVVIAGHGECRIDRVKLAAAVVAPMRLD